MLRIKYDYLFDCYLYASYHDPYGIYPFSLSSEYLKCLQLVSYLIVEMKNDNLLSRSTFAGSELTLCVLPKRWICRNHLLPLCQKLSTLCL